MLLRSLALTLFIVLISSAASAQEEEVVMLTTKLDELAKALDTSNCDAACKAIASMRNAAERICELEPGPRCDSARARVEEARKKVIAACPDCEAAKDQHTNVKPTPIAPPKPGARPRQDNRPQTAETKQEPPPPPPAPTPVDQPVMRSAPADRGCGACAVGSDSDRSSAWLWLLGAALLVRRRKKI